MSEKLRISDLLQVKSDMPFLAVEATVSAVGEFLNKKTADGTSYTSQSITLSDNGSDINAVLYNRPPFPKESSGKRFSFVASVPESGIPEGLKIKVLQGQNGPYSAIYVNAKAVINSATSVQSLKPQTAQNAPATGHQQRPKPAWIPQGQSIGMAINNACDNLNARGFPLEENEEMLWKIATIILRVSYKLEHGKFYSEPKTETPAQ